MTGLASHLSSLIRGERDPKPAASDEFRAHCAHCGQETVWKLAANVIGQQLYKCCQCGLAWNGKTR